MKNSEDLSKKEFYRVLALSAYQYKSLEEITHVLNDMLSVPRKSSFFNLFSLLNFDVFWESENVFIKELVSEVKSFLKTDDEKSRFEKYRFLLAEVNKIFFKNTGEMRAEIYGILKIFFSAYVQQKKAALSDDESFLGKENTKGKLFLQLYGANSEQTLREIEKSLPEYFLCSMIFFGINDNVHMDDLKPINIKLLKKCVQNLNGKRKLSYISPYEEMTEQFTEDKIEKLKARAKDPLMMYFLTLLKDKKPVYISFQESLKIKYSDLPREIQSCILSLFAMSASKENAVNNWVSTCLLILRKIYSPMLLENSISSKNKITFIGEYMRLLIQYSFYYAMTCLNQKHREIFFDDKESVGGRVLETINIAIQYLNTIPISFHAMLDKRLFPNGIYSSVSDAEYTRNALISAGYNHKHMDNATFSMIREDALLFAVYLGQKEVVEHYLKNDVNGRYLDRYGRTLRNISENKGFSDIIFLFEKILQEKQNKSKRKSSFWTVEPADIKEKQKIDYQFIIPSREVRQTM